MVASKPPKKFKRKQTNVRPARRQGKTPAVRSPQAGAKQTARRSAPEARQQALQELHGVLLAIPESKLLRVQWDPAKMAKRALERVPLVAPYLPRIAKLPEVNHHWVNNLATIALALLEASEQRTAPKNQTRTDASEAYQAALELKEVLRDCAKLLIKRGVLPADCWSFEESSRGYVNTGKELLELAQVFTHYAHVIRGKVPLTAEDVPRAAELGHLLSRHAEERRQSKQKDSTELLFLRAYTLLVWAYEETRRCIRFLEPKAEATLMPTLFPRGRKKRGVRPSEEGLGTPP